MAKHTPAERLRHSPGVRIYESRDVNLVVFEGSARRAPVADPHFLVPGVSGKETAQEEFIFEPRRLLWNLQQGSYDFPQLLIDRRTNRIGLLFHGEDEQGMPEVTGRRP